MRLWLDKETVLKSLTMDGDIIMDAEDFYFFKRNEISNEDGFHLEFASSTGGFELFLTYDEYNKFTRQMANRVLDYAKEKDYD